VNRHKRIIASSVLLALASFFVVTAVSATSVHAISIDASEINLETTCDIGSDASFTGMLTLPIDSYNVYVRLPTAGQTADVRAFGMLNEEEGICVPIGSVRATGDAWTLAGTWSGSTEDTQTILQLASPTLNSTLGANRPSVMIISQTFPTCTPTTECVVTIDGEVGYVRPIGTLPNQDSLHIVRPIDPSEDVVKEVTYYVDKEPAYTTKTLMPFDFRYVTVSNQELARVIEYESGQRVVLGQKIPADFSDNFWNFAFRLIQSNPRALIILAWIVGVSVIGGIVLGIIHAIRKHRAWQLDHGFAHERFGIITDADRRKAFLRDHRTAIMQRVVLGVIGLGAILTVVVLVSTYIVQPFKVDGESMESTYKNTSQVFINKVPITWVHIAGREYAPSRGQVVIVRQIFGVTDDIQSAEKANDYLIKRVIGLPNERVVVNNGKITIYNTEKPAGFDPDEGSVWQKTMQTETGGVDVDVTLGKDEIFIVGDNRPESIDSRFNGPILTKQIIGIVE
jgi:signal peptidase I